MPRKWYHFNNNDSDSDKEDFRRSISKKKKKGPKKIYGNMTLSEVFTRAGGR